MTTTTFNPTAMLFVAAYSNNYEDARNGSGASVSDYPWVGQYFGGQFEINQVFVGFDLSALPTNAVITDAKLVVSIPESYGDHAIEVRSASFAAGDAAAFVPGALLSTRPLLASTDFTDGFNFERQITLTNFTRANLASLVLAGADQRTGAAPSGDTTTLVAAATLDVTWTIGATTRQHRAFFWL